MKGNIKTALATAGTMARASIAGAILKDHLYGSTSRQKGQVNYGKTRRNGYDKKGPERY